MLGEETVDFCFPVIEHLIKYYVYMNLKIKIYILLFVGTLGESSLATVNINRPVFSQLSLASLTD